MLNMYLLIVLEALAVCAVMVLLPNLIIDTKYGEELSRLQKIVLIISICLAIGSLIGGIFNQKIVMKFGKTSDVEIEAITISEQTGGISKTESKYLSVAFFDENGEMDTINVNRSQCLKMITISENEEPHIISTYLLGQRYVNEIVISKDLSERLGIYVKQE